MGQAAYAQATSTERQKVADGEYLTTIPKPNGPPELGRESWSLWHISDGSYVVESQIRFEATKYSAAIQISLQLNEGLYPEEMDVSKSDEPSSSNKLKFQFMKEEVRITYSTGERSAKVPNRYAVYFPLTQWMLVSFGLLVPPKNARGIPVQFVFFDEAFPNEPVTCGLTWGRVRYLGEEEKELAGLKFKAMKYLIHLGLYPGIYVWVSAHGVVLATENEEFPGDKTELVRFKEYSPTLNQ